MNSDLIVQLKADGIKYVRWAYAGSYDDGYIVEIKTFDSDEDETSEIDVYNCDPDGEDLNAKIYRYGLGIFEGLEGFEINDGGYGWILLNTDSGECILSEHWNVRGMRSASFNRKKFDRVEFSLNGDWNEGDGDAFLIEAKVFNGDSTKFITLNDEQKCKFISFEKIDGKKKRQGFFDRGGRVSCKVDGACLREFISSLGLKSGDEFYYLSANNTSYSQDDVLTEIQFQISSTSDSHLATIFTGGWSEEFLSNVMDEDEVIDRNPAPSEIQRGLE